MSFKQQSFRVNGAGKIKLSETCNHLCGKEEGFSIGVSWGKYGFCGGVIPKEEARRMAELILKALNDGSA